MTSRKKLTGKEAEILLELCQRIKEKFQLSWRMITLVHVILKYANEDQEEAWRQINDAFLEFRSLAAVKAARFAYRMPYPYSTALYQPMYLPAMPLYHHSSTTLLSTAPTGTSPPPPSIAHSPHPVIPMVLRPGS